MYKDVKMFMLHMNAHQTLTSTEEDFINQVDKMNHCVNTCQPLSQPHLSSLN